MSLRSIYEQIDRRAVVFSRRSGANKSAKHYYDLRQKNGLPIYRLSSAECAMVDEVWNNKVKSYATHELVASASGKFDPYVCSELLFRTHIELAMNDFKLKFGFSDKNYFDKLFPDVLMPKTIVRNINGVFLDGNYTPINAQEVDRLLNSQERVIVKPSLENGCGRDVKMYTREMYGKIKTEFKRNYLIQEVLTQHRDVAQFNCSSVNVMRVCSLSLNNVVSPVNCAFRCGTEGFVTDNHITDDGRGMVVVGVNADGSLKEKGYFSCGETTETSSNGCAFAGVRLPNFEKALALTTHIHEQLPHFCFMGFDICFDESGEPVVMEFNIRGPGVLYYQYANGPLFGDRTKEVIDAFCK